MSWSHELPSEISTQSYQAYTTREPIDIDYIQIGNEIFGDFNIVLRYMLNLKDTHRQISDLNAKVKQKDIELSDLRRKLHDTRDDPDSIKKLTKEINALERRKEQYKQKLKDCNTVVKQTFQRVSRAANYVRAQKQAHRGSASTTSETTTKVGSWRGSSLGRQSSRHTSGTKKKPASPTTVLSTSAPPPTVLSTASGSRISGLSGSRISDLSDSPLSSDSSSDDGHDDGGRDDDGDSDASVISDADTSRTRSTIVDFPIPDQGDVPLVHVAQTNLMKIHTAVLGTGNVDTAAVYNDTFTEYEDTLRSYANGFIRLPKVQVQKSKRRSFKELYIGITSPKGTLKKSRERVRDALANWDNYRNTGRGYFR
jgi:hypothetical protein